VRAWLLQYAEKAVKRAHKVLEKHDARKVIGLRTAKEKYNERR